MSGEAILIRRDCGTELALDNRAILNGFFVNGNMVEGWEYDTDDVEQERIPAGCPRTPAVSVSNCGQRVRHCQHEIRFLFLPVLEPFCTIVVALPNEGIELQDVFHAPALDERRVDLVAKNVAVEPSTKFDQESGEAKYE